MRYLAFFLFLISSLSYGQNVKTFIPPQAFEYRDIIYKEINLYFSGISEINYVPSLIEHESCISLKHNRCWKPTSELRSKREQGLGLGQVTRTFKEDGSIRFDTLANLKNAYKEELREASWDTLKNRPDIQVRMIILLLRSDYKQLYSLNDTTARLQMTDSAYNGGIRDVHRSRRACGLSKNCDPQLWFDNTENYIQKSNKVLYGNRSAIDINKHHVHDVFRNKLPKYNQQYFNQEYLKINSIERKDNEKKC